MNPMMQRPGAGPMMMGPLMQPFMPNPVYPVPQTNEATLYVGNLNSALEETRLMNIFQPFGQVISCRIMRDIYSHESRRFGFVSFASVAEAQKAKDELNYKNVDGFEIRICFKRSPSDFKPDANIFVTNFPKDASTRDLDDLCNQFGKTISCSIRTDYHGKSLGYGYVQFDDDASAKKSIEALDGMEFRGKKLEVRNFVSSKNRAVNKSNIYIRNFPLQWDQARVEKELKDTFGKFGAITCSGVKEHKTMLGERRFYAFVAYETEEAAKKAIAEMHEKFIDPENKQEGQEPLYVVFVQPKLIRQAQLSKEHLNYRNTTNLFVKSLKETVTEEDILRIFGKYGKITSVLCKETRPTFLGGTEIMKFAFVNFANENDANEAYLKGKRDEEVKTLLHHLHKENLDFITYHQSKALRAQYLRIKIRMKTAMMIPQQLGMMMKGPMNKKKGPRFQDNMFGAMGFPQPGPMGMPGFMPPMGMPMMPGMGITDPSMLMMPGLASHGSSALNNNTPSNSSRPGETKEQHNVDWLKKNKKEFLGMNKEQQNNILGNLMYNRVLGSGIADRDLIPKVTGMLIDLEILDYEEIIDILVNDESLKERITEAVEVINDSNAN
jgi:polyadenylate-binding protein